MNLNIDLSQSHQEALNFVLGRFNEHAKAEHDVAQASKPEDQRTDYIPVTPEGYLVARLGDVLTSYRAEYETARAADEENLSLYKAVISAPPEVREAIKAQARQALGIPEPVL